MARHEGLAVFVPRAIPGDVVSVRLVEKRKKYAIAELLDVLKPSPDRVEAPCPAFSNCGGCTLLHMRYEAQLKWKQTLVTDALERIGHIKNAPVRGTLASPCQYHYRNKLVLPVVKEGSSVRIGAYARRTHEVVGSDSCLLHMEALNRLIAAAAQVLDRMGYSAYDERTGRGLVRYVLGRAGVETGEIMGGLVTAIKKLPDAQAFAQALAEKMPGLTTVVQNINPNAGNIVLGEETRALLGKGFIEDVMSHPDLGSLKFRISAASFYQVNPVQAVNCYAKVVRFVAPCERVMDLYCGIGTITLFLAKAASFVAGVEESEQATRDAALNAELNDVTNVRFVRGKVEREMPRLIGMGFRPDAVVLDPPRAGAEPVVLRAILGAGPRRISYMSCYPPTLARDLAVLLDQYELVEVQPVDMFPNTIHVECVANLRRRSPRSLREPRQ